MRILAFHSGYHDSAAAAFDDYRCVAAVQQEQLSREKSSGGVPWLAIDEVLQIAGWTRRDVDAIATTRSLFPTTYLRNSFLKEIDYSVRLAGYGYQPPRAGAVVRAAEDVRLAAPIQGQALPRRQRLSLRDSVALRQSSRSARIPALFYTDWEDALVYTADGIGDNVSYSIRSLSGGKLDCDHGDDRELLVKHARRNSLALAYGYATKACGFRINRHEGKLTGLAARGQPTLAPVFSLHYHLSDDDGLIDKISRHYRR